MFGIANHSHVQGCGSTRLYLYTLEGPKSFYRTLGVLRAVYIHLYHCGARTRSIVRHAYEQMTTLELKWLDIEGGIAQSVAEWEQCIALEIAVCAVLHAVVLIVGEVTVVPRRML